MLTPKQIEGSRANGSKFPARKSEAGTRASKAGTALSMARSAILPGESRKRFDALYRTLANTHRPTNAVERNRICSMTIAQWRKMRLFDLTKANRPNRDTNSPSLDDPSHHAHTVIDRARAASILDSQDACYDVQFRRTLHSLFEFRSIRALAQKRKASTRIKSRFVRE